VAAARAATLAPMRAARVWLERTLGAVFLGLGVRLALADRA
jgi:threonine/homoserine/homoserine lactone efflux protein